MTTYKLFWTRADKQGDIDMGDYASREEAEAAVPAALAEMLAQCGESEQAAEIRAGSFGVYAVDEDREPTEQEARAALAVVS